MHFFIEIFGSVNKNDYFCAQFQRNGECRKADQSE